MATEETNIPPLCDICQILDLSRTNNSRKPTKYNLGRWDEIQRKASASPPCPFCLLLISFIGRYGPSEPHDEITLEWKKKGGFFYNTDGDNLAFLNEDTASSPYGSARAVQPTIDPAMIKKWMRVCEDAHGEACTPKQGVIQASEGDAGVKVLRVIDVQDECIVEASPRDRYIALSYVWGDVVPPFRLLKSNLGELSTKGALQNLRKTLPNTVQHALDLVQLISERYLWVDSLCLIQDNDNDMLNGIMHMDLVYQCAILTIIAAYGSDANAGLPGIYPGSRKVDQNIVEVLPGIKMTPTTGVFNDITGAHRTRGWTLQELVLSHRTLIFTERRIYFLCRTNCMGEDTIYDNFPASKNELIHSGGLVNFLADTEPHPLTAYVSQLFRYADRKLTKQSDTIHALTGILRFLSTQVRSGTLEGLFTSAFDICLLCWDNFPRVTNFARREGFPSWSWAGWEGMRDGYGRYCNDPETANGWLKKQTYIVWYMRGPETGQLDLVWDIDSQLEYGPPDHEPHIGYRASRDNPYGRVHSDLAMKNLQTRPDGEDIRREELILNEMKKRQYHFLHFFAYTILIEGFGLPPESSAWAMVHSLIGSGGRECGGVQFNNPKLIEDTQGPYEFILLSTGEKYDDFFNDSITIDKPIYWVMLIALVGEDKAVAERRGIGFLFQDSIEYVLPPGKVWKEIVLG